MKLLVFGKTGQVATELQRQADVIALGRDQADLSDPAACAEIVADCDADAIINAAAYTAVDTAERDEALATIVNGDAPTAMARAAAKRRIPFLHISTDYVFDGSGERPWKVDDPVAPLGAYGRSKLAGELGVRDSGAHHVILRTSWVFSAHGNNFVKTMLRLSETRDELGIVADQIGGPTAAADIATALLSVAGKMTQGHSGGTYHFSGLPFASWADFATEIFQQAGREVKIEQITADKFPTPSKRPLNSRMDCTTLNSDFGIYAPDWKRALAKVLADLESGNTANA